MEVTNASPIIMERTDGEDNLGQVHLNNSATIAQYTGDPGSPWVVVHADAADMQSLHTERS
jgi:hypothetical protein